MFQFLVEISQKSIIYQIFGMLRSNNARKDHLKSKFWFLDANFSLFMSQIIALLI